MSGIVDWTIDKTRVVVAAFIACVFSGLVAYNAIPKEADPDIPIPIIYVSTFLPGISPEDSERLLVRPLETQLRSIEGIKELRAVAAQGYAALFLEFDVSFDKQKALSDVRAAVDLASPELPADADEPTVREFNTSLWPVIAVVLSGEVPERTLLQLAQRMEDALESIPSVLEADLVGEREELLEVVVDPAKLQAFNISPAELLRAVNANNRLVAAGDIDLGQGRFAVKVPGLFETREDVLGLPIIASERGVVTLGDVAEIRRTFKDAQRFARFNGKPAITIEVTKRLGENVLDTIADVRAAADVLAASFPGNVQLHFAGDQSTFIRDSLSGLESSILFAIVLVMIVVVGALGLRSGLLVGMAIPSSFLIGFLLLYLYGLTVNFMVMFGLVLAVGMLVDGAIIVVEYADRKMAEGHDRRAAFAMAAKRMWWPIISSTATTLAAFVPMLFWPGVSGRFMSFLPITLIFILIASLVMALVFLPVLGSVLAGKRRTTDSRLKSLAASETGDVREVGGITGAYARLVSRFVMHPGKVLGGAVLALLGVIVAYSMFGRGVEFFVETEPDQATVLISARGNLSAIEKRDLVLEVERVVLATPGVRSAFTQTGVSGGGRGNAPVDMIGRINMEFEDFDLRPRARDIMASIRERAATIAGVNVELRGVEGGPPTGKDIQVEFKGISLGSMAVAVDRARQLMEARGDVIEIEDSRSLPGIEWNLTIDREQAGRFGADVGSIGAIVQLVTNGVLVGEYRPDDSTEEVEIRVRYPFDARGVAALDELRVPTAQGLVPISNFVTRTPARQVTQIDRTDGWRILILKANVPDGVLANDVIAELRTAMEAADLPRDVQWTFVGAQEEQQESSQFLGLAMLAALFLMGAILLIQFNSFYHAALILSAIIMSTIGVMLGMLVMDQTFSVIMTGTGIVALAGIVVNNNIVLIDTFQNLLRQGMEPLEAVVRTGAQRLRPVFLTTVTTMVGLMPLMFNLAIDFGEGTIKAGGPVTDWWVQLATAVVFGMGFSTILTLLVTPALLAMPYRIAETGRGVFFFLRWLIFPVGLAWLAWQRFARARRPAGGAPAE